MEKKYQVFISSTYEDLKGERKAVEETIIRARDIPVGMEAFPAADEEQFEFIKTVIDACDYYVLIIAGRYGSLAADGKSYTEKECDYAMDAGIPILVLLREGRDKLPANEVETEEASKKKLEKFIERVTSNRMRKTWSTTDGLKLAVREALDHSKATKPRPGWVRGDQIVSSDALQELERVRAKLKKFEEGSAIPQMRDQLGIAMEDLGAGVKLTGTYKQRFDSSRRPYQYRTETWSVQTTYVDVFSRLSPDMAESINQETLNYFVARAFCDSYSPTNSGRSEFKTDREAVNRLRVQFEALGLIKVYTSKTVSGKTGTFWKLTASGKRLMFESNVVKNPDIGAG